MKTYISVDTIMQRITKNSNWLNWLLLYCNVFPRFLHGKDYSKYQKLLDKPFNSEEKVIEIFNTVVRTTPYYRERYKPISSIKEFKENIGLIERATVINNSDSFISETINRNDYIEQSTGGTTGKPLKFLMLKNRYDFELSTKHKLWNQFGWNYHTRGVLRNHKLPSNKIYTINPISKEIIFDVFRMNEAYAKQVYKVLKNNNIQFIEAYPSSVYLFCRLCKKLNLDLSFLKAILSSSEPVLDFQKHLIVDQLGIQLYSLFGHSEKLIIGGYCGASSDTHFEPTYGYAELVNSKGEQITTIGELGELVGTTFNNLGMPLIRYKTGDYAEFVATKCPHCNKNGLVVKNIISHRNENIIYKSDNTFTSSTSLTVHGYLLDLFDGMQYIQNEKGQLTIQFIKNANFKNEHYQVFYNHYKNAMGKNSKVEINFVSNLTSLPNGKFPLLISSVKNEFV